MIPLLRNSKLIGPFAITLLALVCGTTVIALWQSRAPETTADWLHRQINATTDERTAIELVERFRPLGDAPAIPRLVALLNDPREKTAIAARKELRSRIQAGKLKPQADRERAEALAIAEMSKIPEFRHGVIRAFVRDFAVQIMQRTTQRDPIELLEQCTLVIRRTLPEEESSALNDMRETIPDPFQQTAAAELIGGGLEPEGPPIVPPVSNPAFPPPRDAREPARFAPAEEFIAAPPPSENDSVPRELPPQVDVAPLPPLKLQAERFAETDTRMLMKHLHGLPDVAAAAADELRRRGMDEFTLSLARLLDHPDRKRRLELIEALPQLRSGDAASWLEELALDSDPEVRRRARNTLATSRRAPEWNRFQAERQR